MSIKQIIGVLMLVAAAFFCVILPAIRALGVREVIKTLSCAVVAAAFIAVAVYLIMRGGAA